MDPVVWPNWDVSRTPSFEEKHCYMNVSPGWRWKKLLLTKLLTGHMNWVTVKRPTGAQQTNGPCRRPPFNCHPLDCWVCPPSSPQLPDTPNCRLQPALRVQCKWHAWRRGGRCGEVAFLLPSIAQVAQSRLQDKPASEHGHLLVCISGFNKERRGHWNRHSCTSGNRQVDAALEPNHAREIHVFVARRAGAANWCEFTLYTHNHWCVGGSSMKGTRT